MRACVVHICICICFRSRGRLMVLFSMALARETIKDLKCLTFRQWLLSFLIFPKQFLPGGGPPFASLPNVPLVYAPQEWDHSERLWIPSIHIDKRVEGPFKIAKQWQSEQDNADFCSCAEEVCMKF